MKIRRVSFNNRKRAFEIRTAGRVLWFPYTRLDPAPRAHEGVVRVGIDVEIGGEGFAYVLASGRRGLVHVEQVLEYNRDPRYFRDLLLYRLTLEARKRRAAAGLSTREIIRRLGTSATQLYRLLDPTNYRKSLDQVLALLRVLDCEVEFVVRPRSA